MPKRETDPWQGLSKDDLSFVCDRYAPNTSLNKVSEKDNTTTVPEASGANFPHVVVLDFSQDVTLGREETGRSRPATAPITSGWSLRECPVLLDSGACVPMPFLISMQALQRSCPGIAIDPIGQNEASSLSAANGSALTIIGSINLHWRFSGPSVGCNQSGEPDMSGTRSPW